MALTDLTLYLEPKIETTTALPDDGLIEYSRNEKNCQVARVNIIPTPNDATLAGEEITIKVFKARRTRAEEVLQAQQTYTFAGAVGVGGVGIEIDLRRVVYSTKEPFPLMRRGNYYFRVEHTGGPAFPSGITKDTEDFRVALMTVDRFESSWLRGATRRSNDDRAVRFQPKKIPGVRVIEVSKNHPLDLLPLDLVKGAETPPNYYLKWNRGALIPIDIRIPEGLQPKNRTLILPDRAKHHYVVVTVDPREILAAVPAPETDMIMIDRGLIDRETLREWLDEEFDWMEQSFLYTPIEPALIVSDRDISHLSLTPGGQVPSLSFDNEEFDILANPVTYYPPEAGHWISVRLMYGWPIRWDFLEGALETQRIVSVRTSWIETPKSHMLQLVPFHQSLAYHFLGLFYMGALRGPADLPSFWRYRYYAGVQSEQTPRELLELGGMRAAVKALTVLGQMFRGGFSSQSFSKDGVSQSVGYTASAMYGIYSATIEGFQKRLDKIEPQLARKYKGLYIDVL